MPAATAYHARWYSNATQRLCILEWGMAAELITDSLSPKIIVAPLIGTPRYRSVRCKSMTCSVHVLAATCSEPNVAVSIVDCNLECQSIGVLLNWWRMPVTDLLLTIMVKVSIKEQCHSYRLPFWFGSVQRNLFLCISVAGAFPVTHLDRDIRVIRCVSPDLDCSMAHLGKIPMDPFDAIQVSLSWHNKEVRESRHCCGNIKVAVLIPK